MDLNLSSCLAVWYRKMGWLEPIFDISYLTATRISDIVLSLTWFKKNTHNFKSPLFLLFLSLQTWEVAVSEMGCDLVL